MRVLGSSMFNLRYFDSPPGFQGMDKGTQIETNHFLEFIILHFTDFALISSTFFILQILH